MSSNTSAVDVYTSNIQPYEAASDDNHNISLSSGEGIAIASTSVNFYDNIKCGSHSICGCRAYNEDRTCAVFDLGKSCGGESSKNSKTMYFAVYDGHNGEKAVEFVRENLGKNIYGALSKNVDIAQAIAMGFRSTDGQLRTDVLKDPDSFVEEASQFSSGSTACICLIIENVLYVANIGDSRCLLCRGGRNVLITNDHRSCNKEEILRVSQVNGHFDPDGYLGGVLGVSRAFGNFKSNGEKLPGLSSVPEISEEDLRSDDEFVILACDGIFDVMDCQEVTKHVRNSLRIGVAPNEAAESLCKLAYQRKSFGNVLV
ncbi:protein phosphatase 2C domain-containing protein [Cardiosporidium cionae]|uniref:Protein phosphatase 2C domain-containing protein n=1 Tax=Cardiosporidium cionae TaxID=476202 RepID=A0ABQ7JEB0_9APIC|nr:protein phosphatase 2C domain-containing protein [Cardiosporidium cionae]|eukprot:KAF8822350.1 protein phosphatase 2C domain-containing protein [Cardiosporidium cionae]